MKIHRRFAVYTAKYLRNRRGVVQHPENHSLPFVYRMPGRGLVFGAEYSSATPSTPIVRSLAGVTAMGISRHEARVYCALKCAQGWLTNDDIQQAVGDIASQTVRAHTLKLFNLGLIDRAEVSPPHRLRWSEKGEKQNPAYAKRLTSAAEIFGMPATPQRAVKAAKG
jgi:hypothetical protein